MSAKRYLEKIARLPQARYIDRETAERWIERTLKVDPERIDWHIARAAGFGGSEMGVLVAAMEGRPHRMTPNRLLKQKLLKLAPDVPDVDMRRGIQLEDHVQNRFEQYLDRSGIDWVRRSDVSEHLSRSKNTRHSWMRSSPDGIYEIDGYVYIVDFKAPMPDVLTTYSRYHNYDDYKVQLHHYRLDAQAQKMPMDAMALVMYDYKSDDVKIFDVPHDPEIDLKILNAGDYYWNRYLLRGEIPEVDLPMLAVPEDGFPSDIEESAEGYVSASILARKAADLAEGYRKDIEVWVEQTGYLGDGRLKLADYVEVKAKPTFDVEAAVEHLKHLGWTEEEIDGLRGNPVFDRKKLEPAYAEMLGVIRKLQADLASGKENHEQACDAIFALLEGAPVKQKGDFDAEKVQAALVSCNENPEFFYAERLSTGLERKKNPALDRLKEEIEAKTSEMVSELSESRELERNPDEEVPMRMLI